MRPRHVLTSALSALTLGAAAHAQDYFEARNDAMGGAGVASSHYKAAGFANPALLTRFRSGDDFGLILPTVGVFADDESGLADDFDDFADEFDRVEALVNSATVTQNDLNQLAASLQALGGRELTSDAGVGIAVAVPSDTFAWSLHVRTFLDVTAFADVDPADVAAIQGALGASNLPTLMSSARGMGVAVTEAGFSMAHEFSLGGRPLSIGVTPKYQRVDSVNYGVSIETFDDDDFDADEYTTDDGNVNVDVGLSFEPTDQLVLGVMVRDVLSHDFDSISTLGQTFTYSIGPVATLGAAWSPGWFTLAADVDLNARERVEEGSSGIGGIGIDDDTQVWHLGAELDLARWIQLRAGYRGDFEDTLEDAFTGGVGLALFDTVHLEVSGIYVDEDSLGAVAQLSFTF